MMRSFYAAGLSLQPAFSTDSERVVDWLMSALPEFVAFARTPVIQAPKGRLMRYGLTDREWDAIKTMLRWAGLWSLIIDAFAATYDATVQVIDSPIVRALASRMRHREPAAVDETVAGQVDP